MNGILKCGNTVLPAPETLSISDEIIWSASTGRTISGDMAGDIVAEKKTLNISWGFLTEAEYLVIRNHLVAGFFPITFHDDGVDIEIPVYRGTLTKEVLGRLEDGVFYYRNASVDIVQK